MPTGVLRAGAALPALPAAAGRAAHRLQEAAPPRLRRPHGLPRVGRIDIYILLSLSRARQVDDVYHTIMHHILCFDTKLLHILYYIIIYDIVRDALAASRRLTRRASICVMISHNIYYSI